MKKKVLTALAFVLIVSMFFSSTLNAKSNNGKESLVALGDSIPFGYNLGQTNHNPAKFAYPYLIGDDGDLRVRNLGVPGWKTGQLLTALKTDQKYRQAVKHSDYIVLTIGNNDLLAILESAHVDSGGDPDLFMFFLSKKLNNSNVFANIGAIITETRTLTGAPIVMYNVYNPFQLTNPLHDIASLILPGINDSFTDLANIYDNVLIADAYSAFGDEQAKYVLLPNNDIHPTVEGQIKLAEIGLEALGLN